MHCTQTTTITILVGSSQSSLNLNNFNTTIGSLTEATGGDATHAAVLLGTAALTTGGDNTSTIFAGVIGGTGGIVKNGAGTWTLTGTNTYTGSTTINAGTIVIGDGTTHGSIPGNFILANSAAVVFNRSDVFTYAGAVGGNGSLIKAGTGTLVMAAPTHTGTTAVQSGTLRLLTSTNMPSAVAVSLLANFDVNSLNASVGSLTGGGNVLLGSGQLTIGTDNTNSTFDGVLSGTGGLTKTGIGIFTLTSDNTYTGPTNVNAGSIQLAAPVLPTLPSPAVLYTFNDPLDSGTTVTNDGTMANKNATLSSATEVSGIAGAPGGGNVFAMTNSTGELLMNLTNNKGVDLSGGSWTAGLWFDGLFPSSTYRTAFHGNSTTGDGQAIVLQGSYNLGTFTNAFFGTSYNVDGSGTPPTNVVTGWHQIVAVGSAGQTSFYIDGSLVASTSHEDTTDIYAFGNFPGNRMQPFASYLADIDVYQTALTAAQIQTLYLIQRPPGSLASPQITVAPGAALNVNDNTGLSPLASLNSNGATTFAANTGTGKLARTLASITVNTGGLVTVAGSSNQANRTVLITNTLNMNGGILDLTQNDLIVHSGSSGESVLPRIFTQIAAGRGSNGLWTGTGITSSAVAGSPSNLAIGAILNDTNASNANATARGTLSGTGLATSFDGQTIHDGDVLVKYTFAGDADESGADSASDYIQIDNAFSYNIANPTTPMTGWYNGDFNYDGVINGDDYTLIDNAFNTQGSVSFAALPATLISNNTDQGANIAQSATISLPSVAKGHVVISAPSTAKGHESVAVIATPEVSDNTTGIQKLKKRRSGTWEMLENSLS